MSVLYPFTWPGSKYRARKFILNHLPSNKPDGPVQTYVEPFGGAGTVLLNREPAPVEIFNDLDSDLTTFFRVLRDQPEELQRRLALTPYSREEFEDACELTQSDGERSDMERARLFFVQAQQSASGSGGDPSPGHWLYAIGDSSGGMSSRVSSEQNKIRRMLDVAERLRRVQVESLPATDILDRYDTEETLFYIDPPYLPSVQEQPGTHKSYCSMLSEDDHLDLLDHVQRVDGMVALSGFDSDLYTDRIGSDWFVSVDDERESVANTGSRNRSRSNQEVLWTNYDPSNI